MIGLLEMEERMVWPRGADGPRDRMSEPAEGSDVQTFSQVDGPPKLRGQSATL